MNFLYILDTKMYLKVENNPIFRNRTSQLVILCYILKKNLMSKLQAKKLSLKFVPYFFVAVATLTAFGSNGGTWV